MITHKARLEHLEQRCMTLALRCEVQEQTLDALRRDNERLRGRLERLERDTYTAPPVRVGLSEPVGSYVPHRRFWP